MDQNQDTSTGQDTTGQDEGNAALEALHAEALGDIEQQAQAEKDEAVAAIDQAAKENREGLLGALQMARMIAKPAFKWWPDFGECWSDGQLEAIADAGAQVMARHDLSMGELMSEWGPYLALGFATLPPSLATYAAIKERKAAIAAPRPAAGAPVRQDSPPDTTATQGERIT